MTCVSEATAASYTGDGTCDDGTWGYDLTCASSSTVATATEAAAAEPAVASVTLAATVRSTTVFDQQRRRIHCQRLHRRRNL